MNILVVVKQSKLEWESITLGVTQEELVRKYSGERANLEAIMKSHYRQILTREAMHTAFPDATFAMLSDYYILNIPSYDLVIILGGDNSFTKVSHYITTTPVLGVNSDPQRGSGHLLNWSINDPLDATALKALLDDGDYKIEDWTRLEATVDCVPILDATSEYFLGERMRDKMSRHVVEYRGKSYEQKCSGLLVATGVGSTGWYKSALWPSCSWDKCMVRAKFGATEVFGVTGGLMSGMDIHELSSSEELVVHSLNDDDGCVSVDAWDHYDFHRGSTARITIGRPLKVVVPNKNKEQ
jgi:NAD kinase